MPSIRRWLPLLLVSVAALCAACAAPLQRVLPPPPAADEAPASPRPVRVSGRSTVGVAFGGGSARGIAHVGVIRWLEEHRIPIDVAAGTSMGGLVGGAFATGMDARELEDVHRLARLGSALRRLVFCPQEHPPQGRRARLSVASRVRAERRHRAAHRLEQRRVRGVAPRPHRRSLLRRRGLRRPADAVSNGRGRPSIGRSPW